MTQIEITAEIFRIMRVHSDKRAPFVMRKIREHLPNITNEQLITALEELKK